MFMVADLQNVVSLIVNEYFHPNALCVLQFKIDSTFRVQLTFDKDKIWLIRSRLIWIYTVCRCVSELTPLYPICDEVAAVILTRILAQRGARNINSDISVSHIDVRLFICVTFMS